MAERYVDLSTSTTGNGLVPNTPFTFDEFRADVSVAPVDTTYYLKGSVSTSADIIISPNVDIDITNWQGISNINEPWSIYIEGNTSIAYLPIPGFNTLRIRNGRMLFEDAGAAGQMQTTNNAFVIFDNMHLTFNGDFYFRSIRQLYFKDSNICGLGSNNLIFYFSIDDYPQNYFRNTILYAEPNFNFNYQYIPGGVVTGVMNFLWADCVTNLSASEISAIGGGLYTDGGSTKSPIVTTNAMEYEWNYDPILSATDLSAMTSADINYLTTTFNEITSAGNSDWVDDNAYDIYGGTRDGIGALYFPILDVITSASVYGGDVPLTFELSALFSGDNTSASSYYYYFKDGSTSASVELTSASTTYTYESVGTYYPQIDATSFHGWYAQEFEIADPIVVSASELSGAIVVVDASTSATITSAYINNEVAVSSTFLSGTPTTYDLSWGDGTSAFSQSIVDNQIYLEHTYATGGNYDVSAVLINGVNPNATISTGIIIVEEVSQRTFYVDIDRSNDTTATNAGTSGDPFDYGEMITKLSAGSDSVNYDTFKVRGFREISAASEIIETNTSAQYTIDAWDLSAYGPWMICKDDKYLYNYTMSFVGAHTIGGLYYNKPKLLVTGSPLNISKMTNMYIVNQGTNSQIQAYAYETAVSAVSSISGTSASPATVAYFNEDFDTSSFDPWWSPNFSANATIDSLSGTPTNYGAIATNLINWEIISSAVTPSSGDFILEWAVQRSNDIGGNESIEIGFANCLSATFAMGQLQDSGIWIVYSGDTDNFVGSGWLKAVSGIYTDPGDFFYGKLVLNGTTNMTSAYYKTSADDPWTYCGVETTIEMSACGLSVWEEGSTYGLFSYINISAYGGSSADTGLPLDNSTSEVTGSSVNYLVTSAFEGIEIIGSTIYTDSGFKIGRQYTDTSLSASSVTFNIEDSVITGW